MLRLSGRTLFALAATALVGCAPDSPREPTTDAATQVVFSESPPVWFEAYFTRLEVAPDGHVVIFDGRRIVDPDHGTAEVTGLIDAPTMATVDAASRIVVRGRLGEETGWFRAGEGGAAQRVAAVPAEVFPVWSTTGRWIALLGSSGSDSHVRIVAADGTTSSRDYPLPGFASAVTWAPGDTVLLVLVSGIDGVGSLHALDASSGVARVVAEGLDGPGGPTNLAISDDGRFAWLALATAEVPDPEARHSPYADRDLDIYRVDLTTGERRPVVQTRAEELAPDFAEGMLYWVSIQTRTEAVVVPTAGGAATVVAEAVQGPTWRPDSRALGVTTGDWRLVDWALNLDGGVIGLDADGRPLGPVAPIITGYHEDFSPIWSPDGSWIAYHSHRSARPVATYAGEGIADDVFVRRPDAPTRAEVRLTDFGWEVGTPDWAPDGHRLLMTSWDRTTEGGFGGASAWVVDMDPQTGAFQGRTRVRPPPEARGIPTWGAWSPTRGDEIALTFAGPGPNDMELWILGVDGGSPRLVIRYQGHRYGGIDWSSDGEAIFFSALVDEHQQLFRVARTGGASRQMTHDPANLFHPQASPDGRWVAATRMSHVRQILRRSVDDDPGS